MTISESPHEAAIHNRLLEPGKDGVGDYTRELATECARRGHAVFLISLNDPWTKTPVREIPP